LENGIVLNLMKFKIQSIAGDASFRSFYRLDLGKKSKIIVLANKEKYKNLIAYIAVNKYLRLNKINAPKLYNHNLSKGIIIIEDFGNHTFYNILLKKKNKFYIYKKLVDLLIKIQKIKPKSKIKSLNKKIHVINKYSVRELLKESDLFFDWYLPIFLRKKKIFKIKKKINKILTELYNKLYFANSYFVHRDYHVQNLMKHGRKIGVIDNQDALIGNPAYDLVSLIDDVRIKTSFKLKKKIFNYYIKKTNTNHKNNSDKFLQDFNILSVQRSLKIIGIFSRLFKRDKKQKYLRYIPYTWNLLEMRMKSKIFLELRKIINSNIPKKLRKRIITK
tara:strand:+ start:524 stop:1519 length:996 start_codon:yes stop_codon:yes gene_type:complete